MATAAAPRTARPPTTPPAMAATGVDFLAGGGVGVGVGDVVVVVELPEFEVGELEEIGT